MERTAERWTQAHDLALVFLSVAYGTDHDLSDEEISSITGLLQAWREDFALAEVREVVMEAMAVMLRKEAEKELNRTINHLKSTLSIEDRRRVLEDVVRIAEADGILLSSERSLISLLADTWQIKPTGDRLINQSSVDQEDAPLWSLLHDIALIFLVVAHGSTNSLSPDEITTMIARIGEWQSDLDDASIRDVLRVVLEYYAQQPTRDDLETSILAIRDAFPRVQRLAVLNDLVTIAEADDVINEYEIEMISMLAKAWKLDIRFGGKPQAMA